MDIRERFGNYEDSLNATMDGRQSAIWTAIPAIIDSVNLINATVEATPGIQGRIQNRDGSYQLMTISKLLDVPIVFPRGGGYTMTFPVNPGDECLVIFASRNIDAWWQSGSVSPPMTIRMHDLSDGFALVGPWSKPNVIQGISTSTAQFRSDTGNLYVELDKNGGVATVKAPTQIILDSPLTSLTGVMNVLNQGGQTVAATMYGSQNVEGTISAQTDVIGGTGTGAISLVNHVHMNGGGQGNSGRAIG